MKRRRRSDLPPWGQADEQRGLLWHPDAVAFAQRWPVRPVQFSVERFDEFAESRGAYTVPKGAARGSPEWRVLVEQRRKFKARLNTAGPHQRMWKEGIEPFFLFVVEAGVAWEARPTDQAYKDQRLLLHIRKAFGPTVRHIRHCLQSAQWHPDEPWHPDFAASYFEDLLEQKEGYETGLARLQAKFAALEGRLRKRLPPGGRS
jgi:hypothetical protein